MPTPHPINTHGMHAQRINIHNQYVTPINLLITHKLVGIKILCSHKLHITYFSDCPSTYVGQTGRTLMHRLKEHRRALVTANPMTSALAEHAMDTGHDIDWSDAQVIDASPLLQQRCTLESWHIRRQPQPLNRERGMLPTVYDQSITQTSLLSS